MARRQPKRENKQRRRGVRSFWSGTISFGLVNVPVDLFPANRSTGVRLRMLDEKGNPLRRQYYCPAHERDVHPEHIIRGYEVSNGDHVVVRDDELEAIEPKKTREIDLRRFVDLAQVPPIYFQRAYFLTPAGESTKAYRLLADAMERTQRAGIATFVMRSKEYLVAILSERGILRAETLRFHDEVRDPEDVGLPEKGKVSRSRVADFEQSIKKLTANQLAPEELKDEQAEELRQLVEHKRKRGEGVVESAESREDEQDAEEEGDGVDLLETIRRSLQSGNGEASRDGHPQHQANELEGKSKEELYEEAKKRNIPGRSRMSKQQLVQALRSGGGS